ncbi:hypothetical protein GCM10025857_59860 [Alicyclobacillus contaminans]|nr:hypothetical protein GCM10025857_59860 [Alicyclobacillus contaminans]
MEDVSKNLNKLMNQKDYRTRFSEMMTEVLKDQEVQNFWMNIKMNSQQKILNEVMQNCMNLSRKNGSLN